MKKDIYIKLIEFGRKNWDGFNYDDLINNKELNLNDYEKHIADIFFRNAYENTENKNYSGYPNLETIFLLKDKAVDYKDSKTTYVLNLDADFKYIDYQELKQARRMSREAKKMSQISIGLAIFAIICSVVMPIIIACYMTQSIEINSNQFNEIKGLMNDKIK